ncbi:sensor histidine kinase [Sulfurospirillum diekertiae]|uniref:histidine kinase n=1 Tax=Sulfurospirillum diekertiae TaxID=1854492 RepID=A0A290HCN4_9BACT|nr:HAMP domain-containing protein [Sulfurospirillum diekertiae]ATB69312.1 sensor histidine kinase [Sulfurospirillum diekertiae]
MLSIKFKLILWYLLIQTVVLVSFNYALFINVEHNLRENNSGVIQIHEAIEHFLRTQWLLTPFIVILSSFGGYFLMSRYFKPLKEMLKNIQMISAKELSKRIKTRCSDDEINQLAIAFNAMLERLENSFISIKEFNTQTSHELRTPLTIMRGEIEIALRKVRTCNEYQTILSTQLEEITTLQKKMEALLFLAEYDFMKASHVLKSFPSHEKSLLDLQRASCLHASQG